MKIPILATVCASMLIISGLELAEATHLVKATPITSKSFGMKTLDKVCGDKICPKINSKISPLDTKTTQDSVSKLDTKSKEAMKNEKKAKQNNNAMKLWEDYYKTSARR